MAKLLLALDFSEFFLLTHHYIIEFTVIVKPKIVNGFKWIANIDEATLDNLKNEIKIRILSPVLEENVHMKIISKKMRIFISDYTYPYHLPQDLLRNGGVPALWTL
jgi:hypothetical protein